MSRLAGFFLVVVVVVVAAAWTASRSSPSLDQAPDFVLPDLDGKAVRLRDLRGRVVLLNVWATWCAPCVQEMPTLETLHQALADRDLTLLAVSADERPEVVAPWVRSRNLTFSVLLDPRAEVASRYGVTGFPETFVIDRTGAIVAHHIGYRDWAEPEIVGALTALLETGQWPGPRVTSG